MSGINKQQHLATTSSSKSSTEEPTIKKRRVVHTLSKQAPVRVGPTNRQSESVISQLLNTLFKQPAKSWRFVQDPTITQFYDMDESFYKRLWQWQIDGVDFAMKVLYESKLMNSDTKKTGCILAYAMGTGKTSLSVAILHSLMKRDKPRKPRARKAGGSLKRFMVLAPMGLVSHWMHQIRLFIDECKIQIKNDLFDVSGNRSNDTLTDWSKGGGILVLGYPALHALMKNEKTEKILLRETIELVICDECHIIKNENTALYDLIEKLPSKHMIGLTGTPIQNTMLEFYNLAKVMCPSMIGEKDDYDSNYANPISKLLNTEKRVNNNDDSAEVAELNAIVDRFKTHTSNFVRTVQVDVISHLMKEKHEYVVYLKLTESQVEDYKQYARYASKYRLAFLRHMNILRSLYFHQLAVKNMPIQVSGQLRTSKFERVEDNTFTFDTMGSINDDSTNKPLSNKMKFVSTMYDICKENGEKIVIVIQSLCILDAMVELLQKRGIICEENYVRIDANTKTNKRDRALQQFNDNSSIIFIMKTTETGGVGLDLTAANRLIILDPHWNPSRDDQSAARIYRSGQKKKTYIYRLISKGTIEEYILQCQQKKRHLFSVLFDEKDIVSVYLNEGRQKLDLYELDNHEKMGKLQGLKHDAALQDMNTKIPNCLMQCDHKSVIPTNGIH